MKKSLKNGLAIVVSVSLIILIWFAVAVRIDSELIIPTPSLVLKNVFMAFFEASVWRAVFGTLGRVAVSFLISFAVALLFAIAANRFKYLEKAFYPLVAAMRATPTMSVILLCLIWLKPSKSPVAVSFIVVFPMLYSAILNALKNRNKSIEEMAKSYGVGRVKIFFGITVREVIDGLFSDFITILAFNVKLTVAGESLANTRQSIGREMSVANVNFETARLLALTVIAILLSIIIEIVAKLIRYAIIRGINEYNRKKTIKALSLG